jgi:hypothetical protein
MAEDESGRQGGFNIGGSMTVHGNVAGRDYVAPAAGPLDRDAIQRLLEPLVQEARRTSAEAQQLDKALQALGSLKEELSKGERRDDTVVAKLIDGFIGLVPAGVAAVVAAFANPVLGALAGPATNAVLERLGLRKRT